MVSRIFKPSGAETGIPWETLSVPWLLMPWRHKEPGHQQS